MKRLIIPAAAALTPMVAFAQQLSGVENLLTSIGRLVDIALPIVVGIALLTFFWGVAKFIFAQGDETAKVEAKKIMLWGVIALFVMVSVWGLVNFIGQSLNINAGGSAPVPRVQGL